MLQLLYLLLVGIGGSFIALSLYLSLFLIRNKGIREAMYGLGVMSLNSGFILTVLAIPIYHSFSIVVLQFLSFFVLTLQMIGGLLILWGLFYYSHQPTRNMLLFMITFLGGATWTFTIIRALEGDVFLIALVTGDLGVITPRTQLFGLVLIGMAILTFMIVVKDAKKRIDVARIYPKEGLLAKILGIDELVITFGVGLGGFSILMRNFLSVPLFHVAEFLIIGGLFTAQIVLKNRSYLLFPVYMEIMNAIDGENSSIGWGIYVFGPLGPEPVVYKFKNLQFLPAEKRRAIIYELGIKLLSTPSLGGEYDQSLLRLALNAPFKTELLFITTFGKTMQMDNFDERFAQRPYAGFLLLINKSVYQWLLDYGSYWQQFINDLLRHHSLEELNLEVVNQALQLALYDIVSGRVSVFHD